MSLSFHSLPHVQKNTFNSVLRLIGPAKPVNLYSRFNHSGGNFDLIFCLGFGCFFILI